MWKIIVTLVLGLAVGVLSTHGHSWAKWIQKHISWVITGGLIVLLASMGAGLSSNPNLFSLLGKLGYQAFIVAAVSVFGSVLCVWLLVKTVFNPRNGGDTK